MEMEAIPSGIPIASEAPVRYVNVGLAKAPVTSYLNHSDIVIVINQSDIGVM